MRTRYGLSPWVQEFPSARRPDHPRLRGALTTEVVIVGGGLTGSATALACAMAGLRPVLLEQERLGSGASSRAAGLLLPEPDTGVQDLVAAYGLRTARSVIHAYHAGARDAAALLRRQGIRCGLAPLDMAVVADRDDEKRLHRDFEARGRVGLEAGWLTAKKVRATVNLEVPAGIRSRGVFALDPYRACLGLAASAVRRGATIFERSKVTRVKTGRTGVQVITADGVVSASTVVVATGSAGVEFKALRRHFARREAYLALTEPVPAVVRRQLVPPGWALRDTRVPPRRLRWAGDDRLLLTGGDQDETPARGREAVLVQRTGDLMYGLLTLYPAISGLRPEYGWAATYGETSDRLMYIGAHRNFPRHLFALGRTPDSLTGAFVAARILVRALRGAPDKGDEVFGWTR